MRQYLTGLWESQARQGIYFSKRNMTPLQRQHSFGTGGERAMARLPLCEVVPIRITHISFLPVQLGSAGGAFISRRTACPCSYSCASCQGKSYLEDFIIILSLFSKAAAGDLCSYACCKGVSGSPHRHAKELSAVVVSSFCLQGEVQATGSFQRQGKEGSGY